MALALIATAFSVGSQIFGGIAQQKAAARQRRLANQLANDVLARGEFEAEVAGAQLGQLRGRQTAAAAAQGLALGEGTVATIAQQTQQMGERDIEQIRLNAAREAWGIRQQANVNYRAGMAEARGSFLGAATNLATSDVGQSLWNSTGDAWKLYTTRRKFDRAAKRVSSLDLGI